MARADAKKKKMGKPIPTHHRDTENTEENAKYKWRSSDSNDQSVVRTDTALSEHYLHLRARAFA
jgi:hypothetical protein